MQQLGHSKAIDEYHKLLKTSSGSKSRQRPTQAPDGPVVSLLKATVMRPLPSILTPEAIFATLRALWIIFAYGLYNTAAVTLPVAAFVLLAPATAVSVPAVIRPHMPACCAEQFRSPEGIVMRSAIVCTFLALLKAAESTIVGRRVRRWERAQRAVRAEDLEAYYTAAAAAAPAKVAVNALNAHDQVQFVAQVKALAAEIGSDGDALPAVGSGSTYADCVAWLMRGGRQVGQAVPAEAAGDVATALLALERVRMAVLGRSEP